jgi:hypothetical protein
MIIITGVVGAVGGAGAFVGDFVGDTVGLFAGGPGGIAVDFAWEGSETELSKYFKKIIRWSKATQSYQQLIGFIDRARKSEAKRK